MNLYSSVKIGRYLLFIKSNLLKYPLSFEILLKLCVESMKWGKNWENGKRIKREEFNNNNNKIIII